MTLIKGSFHNHGNQIICQKKILVELTGVTSCLLQFDRKKFCLNNFTNVDCKVYNLRNKNTDKRGQLALISKCQFDSVNKI